jgi:hypothetical protein
MRPLPAAEQFVDEPGFDTLVPRRRPLAPVR